MPLGEVMIQRHRPTVYHTTFYRTTSPGTPLRHPTPCATALIGLLLLWLTQTATATAAVSPLESGETSPETAAMTIEVEAGNWGAVHPAQIQQLLTAVADTFVRHVGVPGDRPLRIRVLPRTGSPRVLYERGAAGEYLIHLTAREQRWYQYAYQFSHEICHILSNFDHKDRDALEEVATDNQWFEESLCETASLFTLRRLSEAWAQQPPGRNWVGYAPIFAEYADHLLAQPHRHPVGMATLQRWFEANRPALQATPYQRQQNEVVATQLLQLFERDPRHWRTIAYLNQDTASAAKSFEEYLSDWQNACPPPQRPLVNQTLALFGITPPQAPPGVF